MRNAVLSAKRLDFPNKIGNLIRTAEEHPKMCYSLKHIEFKFCALFAAWESTAVCDSNAHRWFDLWQRYCRRRHHGKSGLTLADPVHEATLSDRWRVSDEEKTKAYKHVTEGLRRVFKRTRERVDPAGRYSLPGHEAPAILLQLVSGSFKTARGFACPEGLESFLLTLIELFERSATEDEGSLLSEQVWREEIRRKRSFGPTATRTLADVTPLQVRRERQRAFDQRERMTILKQMVKSVRQINKELTSYLVKRPPYYLRGASRRNGR